MSKERLKSPRTRLFVAVDLPEPVRRGLVDWQEAILAPRPALRLVPPESLHLTLVFLGWQRERDVEAIAESALAFEPSPLRLAFGPGPVALPPRGRPRLFALGTMGEGVVPLQSEIAQRLETGGFYEPEKRPFWPHVTVARVRTQRRSSRRPGTASPPQAPVDRGLPELPEALRRPFDAVRITLYRSVLRHQGAQYTPLAHIELPTGDGSGQEI